MSECDNIFENLIQNFFIKFGKLQIKGFHGKTETFRVNRTVSPGRAFMSQHRNQALFDGVNEYGTQQSVSNVVKNHAYHGADHKDNTSSHQSTEQFMSNHALPPVQQSFGNHLVGPQTEKKEPVSYNQTQNLVEDSSKDLTNGVMNDVKREILAQESEN